MVEPLLEIRDLVVGYRTPVVGPFSLIVQPGEAIGLAGPNGSGKSTLLRAIANGARIFEGCVLRRRGLTVAWQQQQPVMPEGMPFNGRDYLNCASADLARVPPRLAGWLDVRVDSLSGGQFQLLSVWAALGGASDLVLLDEPTNNLDPEGEHLLVEALGGGLDSRAALLVSHERRFLERTCTQVLEVGG